MMAITSYLEAHRFTPIKSTRSPRIPKLLKEIFKTLPYETAACFGGWKNEVVLVVANDEDWPDGVGATVHMRIINALLVEKTAKLDFPLYYKKK